MPYLKQYNVHALSICVFLYQPHVCMYIHICIDRLSYFAADVAMTPIDRTAVESLHYWTLPEAITQMLQASYWSVVVLG